MSNNELEKHIQILNEYATKQGLYKQFAIDLHDMLKKIIGDESIKVHGITNRPKEIDSLKGKLARQGKSYASLEEITDLAAIRIITYFNDDVDKIAEIVERETEVDVGKTVDKRATLALDQFGYLSSHYVVKVTASRLGSSSEWRKYQGMKAEIQIRSVLQHAWAEIEHDLCYKPSGKTQTLQSMKRRFARVAGLLETADEQFASFRSEMTARSNAASAAASAQMAIDPSSAPIDDTTILKYVNGDYIKGLDKLLAQQMAADLIDISDTGFLIEKLTIAGIFSIGQLAEELIARESQLIDFIKERFPKSNRRSIPVSVEKGAWLIQFAVFFIAEKQGYPGLFSWFQRRGFSDAEEMAREVMEVYEKVKSQQGMI